MDAYRDKLDDELAKALTESYLAGEQDIVFTNFVETLSEMEYEVSSANRAIFRQIAEGLGLLDDSPGKDLFW